eukprot:3970335-Prymnesium_polylepis.1
MWKQWGGWRSESKPARDEETVGRLAVRASRREREEAEQGPARGCGVWGRLKSEEEAEQGPAG